jgi:hypothetical protein
MRRLAITLIVALIAPAAYATSIQICPQKFALCAASTCKPTGKKITVEGLPYDEVSCECPVLDGPSIANTDLMNGSCANPPGRDTIWSLFAPKTQYPQAMAGWDVAPAKFQTCSGAANPNGTTNCWSFACDHVRRIKSAHGKMVTIADCHCPLNEDPKTNGPVEPGTNFLTQAGDGTTEPYCNERPVGGPIPIK